MVQWVWHCALRINGAHRSTCSKLGLTHAPLLSPFQLPSTLILWLICLLTVTEGIPLFLHSI